MENKKTENISETDVRSMLIQPFYAIDIDENLTGTHPKLVTKEQWINAQLKLIKEIGIEQYLKELLETLESPVMGTENTSGVYGYGYKTTEK